jgi:DNA-binding GntR family transcriptional regulator
MIVAAIRAADGAAAEALLRHDVYSSDRIFLEAIETGRRADRGEAAP